MNKNKIKNLLLRQLEIYPAMQALDAVKLLYQSEFAGGHMIEDEAASLMRLEQELEALGVCEYSGEAFEYIGNGLCRMNLRSLETYGVTPETAHRFFIKTAASISGSIEGFEKKLGILLQLCAEGELPFDAESLKAYIKALWDEGCLPVSHSETFRKKYAPAYRVIKCDYRNYIKVFAAIDKLLLEKETVRVAIDGNCGAGKSALASLLGGIYDCNVFHMDDFFLRPVQRTETRLKETGGNVDHERFGEEVITGLKSGGAFSYRKYDCKTGTLGESINVLPKRLTIVEGSYSMHPSLPLFYDLKIFLGIGPAEQSRRILKRNGQDMHKRFIEEWIPLENRYIAQMGVKKKADLVFGG